MAAIILTPADLAAELDTDAKTTRKFLRDNARAAGIEIPGKGSRWEIKKTDVRSLKSRFTKWVAAAEVAKAARLAKAAAPAEVEVSETPEVEMPAES